MSAENAVHDRYERLIRGWNASEANARGRRRGQSPLRAPPRLVFGVGNRQCAAVVSGGMGRHRPAIAVVLGVLAAPAVTPAKEISKVSVCGTTGQCRTYDRSDFKTLMFLAEDAGPTDPPAGAAPWYRVRFTVDEREHGGGYDSWTVAYVPSADSLRVRNEGGDFAWVAQNPRTAAVLKRAIRNLPGLPEGATARAAQRAVPGAGRRGVHARRQDRSDARPDRLRDDTVGLDRWRRARGGARPRDGRTDPAPAA